MKGDEHMDDKIILEREGDAPENWETEVILHRDGRGNVLNVDIPDDEEASEDAGDDQT